MTAVADHEKVSITMDDDTSCTVKLGIGKRLKKKKTAKTSMQNVKRL